MSVPPACLCVAEHRPALGGMVQIHHVLPLSWGGPNTAANRVPLCPNGHELVHRQLNIAVRQRRWPVWADWATRNPYLIGLAVRAYMEYREAHDGALPTILTLHRDGS